MGSTVVSAALETTAGQANIPHLTVTSSLDQGASVILSCDSKGSPLILCFWERPKFTSNVIRIPGRREAIHFDDDVIENDGNIGVEGIFYNGAGLGRGECGLEIKSFGFEQIGRWKCTLLTRDGGMLTGSVTLGK